jgi:hypothetical protein
VVSMHGGIRRRATIFDFVLSSFCRIPVKVDS